MGKRGFQNEKWFSVEVALIEKALAGYKENPALLSTPPPAISVRTFCLSQGTILGAK